ncbi:Uu.00g146360.m01.CDS01 [Anthostomella pinea]|uniref:Uu.00g146360.m01.CDS01 n=1 Tax=Anthostomella pinea TaxID=933095 RepID=A0AAI8VKQ4_9PEZI|nr:Uu.00g146360.m01.CDS01 [Anthostomella pinea]
MSKRDTLVLEFYDITFGTFYSHTVLCAQQGTGILEVDSPLPDAVTVDVRLRIKLAAYSSRRFARAPTLR